MKTINVLWTGGWDSTFIMLQLSSKKVTIQPYYLKDNRKSEELELNTVCLLTEEILKLSTTKCTINPLITKKVSDIENDAVITKAYDNLCKKFKLINNGIKLGSQYEWLARFSKNIDNLELGLEKGLTFNAINTLGKLEKKIDEDIEEYFVLNKQKSSEDLIKIFGNYRFPLLNFSKLHIKQVAEEKGFIDIMNKTWFCHRPINNQPCGKCKPCMQTIKSGLKYRFSKMALFRNKIKKIEIAINKTFTFQ
jgi:7-cyano-7-deazaguanine synthase